MVTVNMVKQAIVVVLVAVFMLCVGFYAVVPTKNASTNDIAALTNSNWTHFYLEPLQNPAYSSVQSAPPVNVSRVFYTRIPKCASTSTNNFLRQLNVTNNFIYPTNFNTLCDQNIMRKLPELCQKCKHMKKWSNTWEIAVTEYITNQSQPSLVRGHVHHIDFPMYMEDNFPVRISITRKPLEKLQSQFYYLQRDNRMPKNSPLRNMTFDECVEADAKECISPITGGYFTIIPMFCGNQPICLYDNDMALNIAKRNVREYITVGLTEYYMETLQILQHLLPQYFTGIVGLYKKDVKMNVAPKKAVMKNSTVTKMKALLHREYDFYYFVKQRFFTQYQAIFKKALTS